jgi:ribosomal protein L10
MNLFLKKYKKKKIQTIQKNYNYLYFFRYHNLTVNENILLKKKIKKNQSFFLILKQNLIKKNFKFIKGQGPILLIYSNQNLFNLFFLKDFQKIKLIFLLFKNQIFSELKLNKISFCSKESFLFNLKIPFFKLILILQRRV